MISLTPYGERATNFNLCYLYFIVILYFSHHTHDFFLLTHLSIIILFLLNPILMLLPKRLIFLRKIRVNLVFIGGLIM